MSLARALTRRYKTNLQIEDTPKALPAPTRAQTVKRIDRPIDRSQISLPIELISTTNVLAYEAPDIFPVNHPKSPLSASSSAGSLRSDSDSDHARSSASSMTTPDLSRESSPTAPEHKKSSYFGSNATKSTPAPSAPATPAVSTFQEPVAPHVPSRALSHTKKNHQALARKRSMRLSNKSSNSSEDSTTVPPPPLSPAKAPKTPATEHPPVPSGMKHQPEPAAEHPFEAELAQVKEVAEEFGVHDVCIWDEEEQWLLDHGLGKYGVDDYLSEIQPLHVKFFGGKETALFSPTWL